MEWTIQHLGALGEFVGSLAVLATLVYLASQIRQNTMSLRTAAKQGSTDRMNGYYDLLLTEPNVRRVFNEGVRSFEDQTWEDRDVFGMLMYKSFLNFSEAFYQYRRGYFEEDQWIESREALDWHLARQGPRSWWRANSRRAFPDEFSAYVEQRMSEIQP